MKGLNQFGETVQPKRRWLDHLVSRTGIVSAALLICALSVSMAVSFTQTVDTLAQQRLVLKERQIGNARNVLSSIANMRSVVIRRPPEGQIAPEWTSSFVASYHILKRQALEIYQTNQLLRATWPGAVSDPRNVILVAANEEARLRLQDLDRAAGNLIRREFVGREEAMPELTRTLQDAGHAISLMATAVEAEQRVLIEDQRQILRRQNAMFLGVLVSLTFLGLGMLALLRGEVRERIRRETAERRADFLAYFDPLTGLANRVRFKDLVEEALANRVKGALLLIDLDGFKEINDRHGHVVGDAVLKAVGRRIRAEAEANVGHAARLGGDEFAVFLSTDNTVFLRTFCEALVSECARAVVSGDHQVSPAISVGLATTTQLSVARAPSYDALLRVTDFALYASKAAIGRGVYTFYDSDLERRFSERRTLMKELPRAIRNGELEVYFQAKVDLATRETYGFEALVRWQRDGQWLPPSEFIGIAEESGRIVELDRYVLERSVAIVSEWNRSAGTRFAVSVNLSGVHFQNPDGLGFVREVLETHAFAPALLTLEITETVQVDNWEQVGQAVDELRAAGCRISIDDFGSGYSSLAYLRTIAADELKIDKSLVAGVDRSEEARFILDAVLDLARSLRFTVVVEGIERPEQRDELLALGCRYGQGFLFDRPKPAAEALAEATPRIDARRGLAAS